MKYLEKYDLYMDSDLVFYKTHKHRANTPECYLTQVKWVKQYNGYLYFRHRTTDGQLVSIYQHRIIAELFILNPDNKPTVDHINRDRSDNRPCNLRWATRAEQAENTKRYKESTPERLKIREMNRVYYNNNRDKILQQIRKYQKKIRLEFNNLKEMAA